MSFGRFPSQWVKSDGLRAFSAGRRPGEQIAALKLYLAAAAYSEPRRYRSLHSKTSPAYRDQCL
jgi:hypothetical protein